MAAVMIAGEMLPERSHIWVALMRVPGIGKSTALKVCACAGVASNIKVCDLSGSDMEKIRAAILELKLMVGASLREQVERRIDEIISLGCYRGIRLRKRLPVNGQRTHNNAKTAKKMGRGKRQGRG